jgi:organic hydroperoxide reductase OsmC/OhrA
MGKREPMHYEVTVEERPGAGMRIAAGDRPPIAGGPPPEFGGSARDWSPEHLFVSSVALCFLATLDWYARRRGVEVVSCRCRGDGTVELGAHGFAFTRVALSAVATARPGQAAQLRELMDLAKQSCLVANSLVCPVELACEVGEEAAARAG